MILRSDVYILRILNLLVLTSRNMVGVHDVTGGNFEVLVSPNSGVEQVSHQHHVFVLAQQRREIGLG